MTVVADPVVIGAGTTGSAIAYHLTQRGYRPLLLDRVGAAGGASGSSAAMLRQHYLDPAIVALARFGALFLADMKARTGFPSGFVGCGYVVVAAAHQEARVREAHAAMRSQGARAELLTVDELRELEPRLRTDDLAIGCYEPEMGYCEPLFVASGFAAAAERGGATLRFGCAVRSIIPDGGGYRLELEDGAQILVETCIVAAGAWSNDLLGALGGAVPLTLRRGQVGRYRPPAAFGAPGAIISDHVHELWMRPDGADGHYLVGGRGGRPDVELAAPETLTRGADDDRLRDFERELGWRLPATRGGIWRGSWASFYDFTPDGNPVADRVPGHERLIVATGGSGHAFKLAPALGVGVSELVCDGDVHSFDWSGLRFGRFA
jgi:glycine/D-amino acid oxidase-like deaminating enzyme